jgi:formate dehydrogenase iron-sulfur subunit
MALLLTPELCFGCRACQIACKSWNQLAADKTKNVGSRENPPDLSANNFNRIRWIEVPSQKDPVRWLFVSQRCMHCGEAGCMKVCPSPGALTRSEEGAVVTNKGKCVGCHLCLAGCPFNIPRYGEDGKLAKCTMCVDRMAGGLIPSCAKTCPTGAIAFGERDAMLAKAQEAGYSTIYGQTDLGGLGALFAFKDAPLVYGYADKPAINEWVLFWEEYLKPGAWILTGGVVALSALHFLAAGPHRVEEPSTITNEKKDETKRA